VLAANAFFSSRQAIRWHSVYMLITYMILRKIVGNQIAALQGRRSEASNQRYCDDYICRAYSNSFFASCFELGGGWFAAELSLIQQPAVYSPRTIQ
jgi:hypothetical protein